FLHTPFPVRNTMVSLPHHRELVRAMLCYDLIGFQTEEDLANFADYLQQELGLTGTDSFVTQQGVTRLGTFPIGIDVETFAERAVKAATRPEVSRLRSSLQGARLVIGVDRVDYSKGLPNRLRAFDRMLQFQPGLKRAVASGRAMPNAGRRERGDAMMKTITSSSLTLWMNDFVSALGVSPRAARFALAPDLAEPPPRRRAELTAIQS